MAAKQEAVKAADRLMAYFDAGEDVKNRGATLKKRLAKLPDAKGDDDAK